MKLSSTDKKVLGLLNSDTSMMYPVEYITEKLNISPSLVYNSIWKLKKAYPIEKSNALDNKKIKYYSLKS